MDFFEAQDQARKRTKWLVLWFFLAILGVVAAVNLLVFLVLGGGFDPGLMTLVSVLTGGSILAASGFKSMQLNGGGAVVAQDLGGRLVMPGTTDFEEKRLLNVVEEMALAAGMAVPQVYLMDQEESINAFAAGSEPSNAVIGITRGCLQRLSRDELAGVVAHEFSHILNGDMRLNMRLMGMVFGLVVISIIGRTLFELVRFQSFSSRRNSREGNNAVFVMIALGIGLIIIGAIGAFFGRLIQAAISRQREFLADASAVQFTRNPDGITGALKKIGGLTSESKMRSSKAMEASHMFFSNGGLFSFGLATHPPLEVRIKAVDQSWDGEFAESRLTQMSDHSEESRQDRKRGRGPLDALPDPMIMGAVSGFEATGQPEVSQGEKILGDLPEKWRVASHNRDEAQALLFGLLLANDGSLRKRELTFVREKAGEATADAARRWKEEAHALHSSRKIALIELALPTLRGLSHGEYARFSEILQDLIASDGSVDLFEFMVQRMITRHLASHFEQRAFTKIRFRNFDKLLSEGNFLVSAIAEIGADDEAAADAAHAAATELWSEEVVREKSPSLASLDPVLEKFDQSSPLVKRQLLTACGKAVERDGKMTSGEAELLRTIADAIGCPLPPFVEGLTKDEI